MPVVGHTHSSAAANQVALANSVEQRAQEPRSERRESPVALVRTPTSNTSAPAQTSREESHRFQTLVLLFSGALDPMAALTGMQSQVRNRQTEQSAEDVRTNETNADSIDAERMETLEKAMAAAEKAMKKVRPKWLKQLIGGILTAVGSAASWITGGASVALAVVGIALLVAADLTQFIVEKRIENGKASKLGAMIGNAIAAALRVAAAVVQSCAPGGAAAAANTFQTVASIAGQVASHVESTVTAISASLEIQRASCDLRSINFRLDADALTIDLDAANERAEDAMAVMVDTFQAQSRAIRRIHQIVEMQGQGMTAATQLA